MRIDGAIFDMDGTLLDSMWAWGDVGADYLRSRGVKVDDDLDTVFKTMNLPEAAEYSIERFKLTESKEDIVNGILEKMNNFYFNEVKLKPGVREFIERLHKNGVKMCIATASERSIAEAALKLNKVFDYFDAVFTSTEVGRGKEYPDIYFAALEHIGTKKEYTPVFEDALYAARTAKKAGFPLVGVYDDSEKENSAKIKELSDLYIYSFERTEGLL